MLVNGLSVSTRANKAVDQIIEALELAAPWWTHDVDAPKRSQTKKWNSDCALYSTVDDSRHLPSRPVVGACRGAFNRPGPNQRRCAACQQVVSSPLWSVSEGH